MKFILSIMQEMHIGEFWPEPGEKHTVSSKIDANTSNFVSHYFEGILNNNYAEEKRARIDKDPGT